MERRNRAEAAIRAAGPPSWRTSIGPPPPGTDPHRSRPCSAGTVAVAEMGGEHPSDRTKIHGRSRRTGRGVWAQWY